MEARHALTKGDAQTVDKRTALLAVRSLEPQTVPCLPGVHSAITFAFLFSSHSKFGQNLLSRLLLQKQLKENQTSQQPFAISHTVKQQRTVLNRTH